MTETMPFGKYRGQSLAELPDDYLRDVSTQLRRESERLSAEIARRDNEAREDAKVAVLENRSLAPSSTAFKREHEARDSALGQEYTGESKENSLGDSMTINRVSEPINVMREYRMTGEVVVKIEHGQIVGVYPKREEKPCPKQR